MCMATSRQMFVKQVSSLESTIQVQSASLPQARKPAVRPEFLLYLTQCLATSDSLTNWREIAKFGCPIVRKMLARTWPVHRLLSVLPFQLLPLNLQPPTNYLRPIADYTLLIKKKINLGSSFDRFFVSLVLELSAFTWKWHNWC